MARLTSTQQYPQQVTVARLTSTQQYPQQVTVARLTSTQQHPQEMTVARLTSTQQYPQQVTVARLTSTQQHPQEVTVARLTSTQQQSDYCQHSNLISKVHFPFSNQSSHFLPQPASFMSCSAYISSFYIQPQNLMPFTRHDHPLSSTHDNTSEYCLS